jgi:hypothetical protein
MASDFPKYTDSGTAWFPFSQRAPSGTSSEGGCRRKLSALNEGNKIGTEKMSCPTANRSSSERACGYFADLVEQITEQALTTTVRNRHGSQPL